MKRPSKAKIQLLANELTLKDIGDLMDLTKERVRQIEVKALVKLQRQLELRNLKHINQII